MPRTKKFTINTIMTLAITIYAFGCDETSTSNEIEEGISVTTQSEMNLEFISKKGDSFVECAIHRTGLRPEELILDPEIDSPYTANIVIRNRYGFPFVVSGDHTDEENVSFEPKMTFSQKEQLEDLWLAIEAIEKIEENSQINEQFKWELSDAYGMINSALNGANGIIDGTIVPEPTPNIEDIDSNLIDASALTNEKDQIQSPGINMNTPKYLYYAPYTHTVAIYRTPFFWPFGEHSAVLLYVHDNNDTFVGQVSTRNHGREATHWSMMIADNCPKSFSGRANMIPPFQPYITTDTAIDGDAGGCNTEYGFNDGEHVCNDDSYVQYLNVKYNAIYTWPTCDDDYLRSHSPVCY